MSILLNPMKFYTVMVGGYPIEGSTDDMSEALESLTMAKMSPDYDARDVDVMITDVPLAW